MSARLAIASATAGQLSQHTARAVHKELREPAEVMHRLQQQWETVTTLTKPSHEYVTATTTLHASLSAIEQEILPSRDKVKATGRADGMQPVDLAQALADLRYAATDLVELTHTAAKLAEPLIRSEVVFAPARILPSTMERLHDRNSGRFVAIQLSEGAALIDAAQNGHGAARRAQTSLESCLRPAAAVALSAPPLDRGLARREFEPAVELTGPDVL